VDLLIVGLTKVIKLSIVMFIISIVMQIS